MNESKAFNYIKIEQGVDVTEKQVYEGFCEAIKVCDAQGIRDIYHEFPSLAKKVIDNEFDHENYPLIYLILRSSLGYHSEEGFGLLQIEQNTLTVLTELVKLGLDVNQEWDDDEHYLSGDCDDNYRLLDYAVYGGFISVTDFLLKQGAASHYHCERELKGAIRTPLNHAMDTFVDALEAKATSNLSMIESSQYPAKKMIELLLNYGANINDTIGFGTDYSTTLGKAVWDQNIDMINFLISYGANVSAIQNEDEDSILHLLFLQDIKDNTGQVVDVLLANGADAMRPNKYGWNTIAFATLHKNEEILEKLLRGAGLLEVGKSPIEIGIKLVKECVKNFPVSDDNAKYYDIHLRRESGNHPIKIFDFLCNLISEGHNDLLDTLFNHFVTNYVHPLGRICIESCITKHNYKAAVHLLEKMPESFDTMHYRGRSSLLLLLDESFIYNPVKNFYFALLATRKILNESIIKSNGLIVRLIKLEDHEVLKLKTYIDSLNPKLSHHLNSIKKEVNHEKLSSEFRSLKPIKVMMQKLGTKPIKPDSGPDRELCDYIENILEQFSTGFSIVKAIYNPSCFYLFFTRNQRRFEKSEEQPEVNEKVNNDMESIISNTLSYLDFEKAADFSLILGKNFSKNLASFFTTNKELVSTNSGFDVDEHDLSCTSPVEKLPKIGEHDES
ncbi:hypothetical protein phytr_4800 [Candidatus Phycorickettsia trachydisci]|uniref:Uncharacterized protein n=1 Tax=Candidatus Phycorickettsia trachydisci TaxID=2115978 RepID=A0A2P1P828_9RICK|nr:ankyrin repeat domain-containing protein [Candidatus Phycorickettsia trachydisci]AVP87429.1 hypothetical protein phytr_4800 [Candidatus Phycorickettsia trachydisci]